MLTDEGLARVIGYGEDCSDCYLILRHLHGRTTWWSCVGGYYWIDILRGQNPHQDAKGRDWNDYSRIDHLLELNGAPKEGFFRVDLKHNEDPALPYEPTKGDEMGW